MMGIISKTQISRRFSQSPKDERRGEKGRAEKGRGEKRREKKRREEERREERGREAKKRLWLTSFWHIVNDDSHSFFS